MRKFGKTLAGSLSAVMIISSMVVPGGVVFADTKIEINEKNFPDKVLREAVKEFDSDENGYFDDEEIENALFLSVHDPFLNGTGIKNTKGIEYFTNLRVINLSFNEIEEIDLSKNEKLEFVSMDCNKLTSIDVSNNPKLTNLHLGSNELTSIDLSNNPDLTSVSLQENKISSIDVSANCLLETINLRENPITSIDVTKMPKLRELNLNTTKISSINVSKNPDLSILDLYGTGISSVDLSKNPKLVNLDVSETSVNKIDASKFPDLERLSANFTGIDSIDVTKNPKLKSLSISETKISSIDVSKNPLLKDLSLSSTKISKIDLSNNPELEYLFIDENELTNLDVTKCPKLKNLAAGYNSISSIDISKNTELNLLNLSGNSELKSVDLSKAPKLMTAFIINCDLESIDVSSNPELEGLFVGSNRISKIDISKNPKLKALYCSRNDITELNLKGSAISELECYDNNLKSIDLTDTNLGSQNLEYFEGLGYKVGRDLESDSDYFFVVEDLTKIHYKEYGFLCDSSTEIIGLKNEFVNPTEIKNDGSERFVERLYTTCLGREAEKEGVEYWTGELKKGFSGGDLARNFFFSEEFLNQNLTDEEFITRLYGTFMAREADADGLNYWAGEMKSGKDKNFVFDGFVNSPEWAAICRDFKIVSGGTGVPVVDCAPSKVVRDFAKRLYTTCLGRAAEEDGLLYWSTEIANLRITGTQAATNFFFSDEFVNAKYDNKEFVTRLYGTFMDRTPDADGLNYWVGQLDQGVSRMDVLNGFSVAPEFEQICINAGIMR